MKHTRKRTQDGKHVTGDWGTNRVRIVRHHRTGALCLDWSETGLDGKRRRRRQVLTGATWEQAKAAAERKALELRVASGAAPKQALTVRTLFDRYLAEVTPRKGASSQTLDSQAARLFGMVWGERNIESLRDADFQTYSEARRRGQLRLPRGAAKVRDTQIGHELKALRAACNWALRQPSPAGGFLLDRNPLTGYRLPKERDPNRPVLTDDEYRRLVPVAWEQSAEFGAALVLTHETGHRIASVLKLRWEDVNVTTRRVTWKAASDKSKREHVTVLTDAAVDAVNRLRLYRELESLTTGQERPTTGSVWLFPSPLIPGEPRERGSVYDWWANGERAAGLAHVKGRGWHSLRRKFATELVEVPLAVLAQLGGWSTARTILECYQHPDEKAQEGALSARRRHVGNA